MRRKLVLLSMVASALMIVTAAMATPPSFSVTTVALQELSGEPSIAVDASGTSTNGTIYYIGPGASALFISTNQGASFTSGPAVQTAGDSDVVVDGVGNVYTSALLGESGLDTTVPVQTLTPGGASIVRTRYLDPAASGIECDRQWSAAHLNGHVATSAECNEDQVWTTTDGWATVSGPYVITPGVLSAGPLVYAPNGTLLQGVEKSDGIYLAKSSNEGHAWTTVKVSSDIGTLHWPVVAADDSNNLYMVYSISASNADMSGGGYMVLFTASTDGGSTWGAPRPLSSQIASPVVGNTPSSIFPWITGGASGKVAVSWWQARDPAGGETDLTPDTGLPTTKWDVIVDRSDNATAASPTWGISTAVSGFHTGSECTLGLACVGPQNLGFVNTPTPFDRRDLDFFETAISQTGALYIAYPQDRPQVSTSVGDYLFSWIDFKLARQTGGSLLR
ncbi:MAG: sialidase family protein [Actinomycetota bacterium]